VVETLIRDINPHNAKQEVGDQTNDLDERQPELGLSKRLDTQQLKPQERKLPRLDQHHESQ
jgi:hypothetical protein